MFAIIAEKIVFPKSKYPQPGMILIDEKSGKIVKSGSEFVIPDNIKIIHIKNYTITSGLIDCHSHIGLSETGRGDMGDDVNELSSPITPQMQVLDGVDYRDIYFYKALKRGVTVVGILPGPRNIFGGRGIALYTGMDKLSKRLISSRVGLKCAVGEIPQHFHEKKSPQTKMATMALFKQTIVDAKYYWKKNTDHKRKDLLQEAFIPVFEQKIPLRIHVYRQHEIEWLLHLAREFQIKIVLEHAYEALEFVDELASQNIPVVCNPYFISPSRKEQMGICPEYPIKLANKGVLVALTTNHPEIPVSSLIQIAGLANHYGLPWHQALESITFNPAKILGIEHLTGSIQEGKFADLVVWDRDPLDWKVHPVAVFLKGALALGKETDLI